ncbi:hypothetical protein LJR153_005061 [Paenibacillus sp. LjRoot153]
MRTVHHVLRIIQTLTMINPRFVNLFQQNGVTLMSRIELRKPTDKFEY